ASNLAFNWSMSAVSRCTSARNAAFSARRAAFSARSWAFSAPRRALSARTARSIHCSAGASSGRGGGSGRSRVASMPGTTRPGGLGSATSRGGRGEAAEALGLVQVDALEEHVELGQGQLHGGGALGGLGEVVASPFEALAEQAQAVPAPVEHLE